MTGPAARLARAEQRLRLDRDHEECPRCDGTGLDDTVTVWWLELRPALDKLRAAILAKFPHLTDPSDDWSTDEPPDPMPAPRPCLVCDATGRASLAAAAAHDDMWGRLAALAGLAAYTKGSRAVHPGHHSR